jgi:molybdopterin-synthase adenylyltransferase
MIQLTIAEQDVASLRDTVLGGSVERAAVLFASCASRSDGSNRLLVRSIECPEPSAYLYSEASRAALTPTFVAAVGKRAKQEGLSLVFAHSHPGSSPPQFSVADDEGERHLAAFLDRRLTPRIHAAIVLSEGGVRARELGTQREASVLSLGAERRVLFDPTEPVEDISASFDRQVRAFGAVGQRVIQRLRVGIVGLGGTGSIVAQQLAYLGVRRFLLIDPDSIEHTNLNRVVGACVGDLGQPKVHVAARHIRSVAADADVAIVHGDVTRSRMARRLTDADFFFGCTDSHGSRAVLQQVAYQYLIPCIDVGTTIVSQPSSPLRIVGRVQLLAPGHGCFTCSGLLDPDEVRRDMMTAFERKLDPYIQGVHEPAPSVIALNGTVASMAVMMFMAHVVGVPSPARYLSYDGVHNTLRSVRSAQKDDCYICSRNGTFARGDAQILFARQD